MTLAICPIETTVRPISQVTKEIAEHRATLEKVFRVYLAHPRERFFESPENCALLSQATAAFERMKMLIQGSLQVGHLSPVAEALIHRKVRTYLQALYCVNAYGPQVTRLDLLGAMTLSSPPVGELYIDKQGKLYHECDHTQILTEAQKWMEKFISIKGVGRALKQEVMHPVTQEKILVDIASVHKSTEQMADEQRLRDNPNGLFSYWAKERCEQRTRNKNAVFPQFQAFLERRSAQCGYKECWIVDTEELMQQFGYAKETAHEVVFVIFACRACQDKEGQQLSISHVPSELDSLLEPEEAVIKMMRTSRASSPTDDKTLWQSASDVVSSFTTWVSSLFSSVWSWIATFFST